MEKIINILNTNNYSINLKSDYTDKNKINSYYPTFNNMRLLDKVLLSMIVKQMVQLYYLELMEQENLILQLYC